jgi:N-acetylglucosaminyldiphosphoundecaprenol N-acetyl-beta-D-mannosaminyltransferase
MECFQSEGVGIRLAGWMRGHKAHYNFAGTDLIPRVCKEARGPVRVFFYGATEESNLKAVEKIQTLCPLVEIAGRVNGFVDFEKEALPAIQKSNADVVLFALGTPKQELLMLKYKEQFNAKVTVTCGGLFDFLADLKPRAPQWMRLIGMEWFFRLSLEPKRLFKRYVYGNPAFMLRSIAALPSDLKKMRGLRK